jgi:lipopolysaccharide/colanic/teichoic acid biosynthesis glycosyltransferase
MYIDAEERKKELMKHNEVDGPVFKMKNDPRVTPVGRIIRKLSIDELPQLFNVLKGDMSLIGPRPPVPQETAQYENWQWRRLDITPGLTCIWQVYGRSRVTFNQWMRMDIEYIRRRGLLHDLHLLFSTIPAVLFGSGAH